MTVEHVRMDNRLIHGQVLVKWNSAIDIDHIIVTNDDVANDPVQVQLLKAVAPLNAKVSVLTIDETVEYCQSDEAQDENIFIIAKLPQDGRDLVKKGLDMDTMNLGNQAYVRGSEKLSNNVYLTKEGVKALQDMHEMGVKLTLRLLPGDSKKEIWPRIEQNFSEWVEEGD
jgi:mannose/fructose/N-acetylgalactosamine-specific phosphotransferase system component IIB